MYIKRSTRILIAVLTLVFFTSIAQAAKIKKVSKGKTQAFLKQLETDHQKAWAEIKAGLNKRNPIWVQPENKDEECKVVIIMGEGEELPSMKFYWDGECKDGYAHGLGRAFQDSTKGLVAWLEEYEKPGELPLNYYVHHFDLKQTVIGFQNSKEPNSYGMDGSVFAYSQNIENENFTVRRVIFDSETGTGYFIESGYASDIVRKGVVYANGVAMQVDWSLDPNSEVKTSYGYNDWNSGKSVGYGAGVLRNGQVQHGSFEDGVISFVKLPEEFLSHLATLEKDIDAHLGKVNSRVQAGNLALEVYKRRTCSGDLDISYMDKIMYGQICLDTADFTPYVGQIEELKKLADKRRESNAQLALRQQEIDARNQAAYAQQQQANIAVTNQALADLARQTQQMQNSTTNMLNNMMNNSAVPALGSWAESGSSQRKTAVCHVIGNVVSCR